MAFLIGFYQKPLYTAKRPRLYYMSHLALITIKEDGSERVVRWLADGRAGNVETLLEMRRIVRETLGLDGGKRNAALLEIADNILREGEVDARNDYEVYRAVHEFIALNVAYAQDSAGGYERLQYPLETLNRGYGDCDDLSILELVLLGLCGIQSFGFEAADYSDSIDGYDHVYCYVNVSEEIDPTGRYYLDPTRPENPLGWREESLTAWVRMPVTETESGMTISGLRGLWSTIIGIGGLVAAPFTGGASIPIAAAAGGIVGGKEAKSAGEKLAGKQFEEAATTVTAEFDAIQKGKAESQITVADYNQAAELLNALADIVSQHPISYIVNKWNGPGYKSVYEERLNQIKTVALRNSSSDSSANANSTTGATDGEAANVGAAFALSPTVLLAGAGVAGFLVLKMILGR